MDANHLAGKLVYYRVPATVSLQGASTPPADALAHKLHIKDGPFYDWIECELRRRAPHVCVDTMDQFRRHEFALTRAGQIKAPGGRHEKDDSHRIDDRRFYVLGWSNEQKIDALLADAQRVQAELNRVDEALARLSADRDAATKRKSVLEKLPEVAACYDDIDWESMVAEIARLQHRKRELEAASGELARIGAEIERTEAEIDDAERVRRETDQQIGKLTLDRDRAQEGAAEAASVVAEPPGVSAAWTGSATSTGPYRK